VSPEEASLASVVGILERLEISYMLTGSVAASYYGRPRATHDADLVIDPTPRQLDALVAAVASAGFYADLDGARAALRERRQFNVIEIAHACKIDLIVRRTRPFSEEEFARRRSCDLPFARGVSMVSPEDSVLSKLEWARQAGDSEKQLADAIGIVAMNPSLDRIYIERWAGALGVADLWRRVSETG
jgi:hypothetical protein